MLNAMQIVRAAQIALKAAMIVNIRFASVQEPLTTDNLLVQFKFMIENGEKSWFWILINRKMFQCWPTLTETWTQSLNSPCQKVQKSIDHARPCSMDSIIYLADVQKHAKLVLLIQNDVFYAEQAISPLIFNMVDVKRSWCQTNELSYALAILARHVPGKFLFIRKGLE